LTTSESTHRVRDAPSTERPRLMALRVVVASAVASREAGRRRHRLGAFSYARMSLDGLPGRIQPSKCSRDDWRKLRRISTKRCLTGDEPVHRVPDAPSTECLRLMALRVVVASAVVSREVGRGRHRLGAFLFGAYPRDSARRALLVSSRLALALRLAGRGRTDTGPRSPDFGHRSRVYDPCVTWPYSKCIGVRADGGPRRA
jgi:hypothetical protein